MGKIHPNHLKLIETQNAIAKLKQEKIDKIQSIELEYNPIISMHELFSDTLVNNYCRKMIDYYKLRHPGNYKYYSTSDDYWFVIDLHEDLDKLILRWDGWENEGPSFSVTWEELDNFQHAEDK